MLRHAGIRRKWCSVNHAIKRIAKEDVLRKLYANLESIMRMYFAHLTFKQISVFLPVTEI